MRKPCPRRQRGITLIEAMITFLVLSIGMLAIVRVQTHLRLNADTARQRSEAVRLAQEDIESLRAFAVLAATPGLRSFDAIASESRTVEMSTVYRIDRRIDAPRALQARGLRVTVTWVDRSGNVQQVALPSVIAGVAPSYSGALGLARTNASARGAYGRSVRIPLGAKDLGDGRSALKPVAGGTFAFVFDNASGLLTGRCAAVERATSTGALTRTNLGACESNTGHLLSGIVRFSSALPPDAARASDEPLPFTISMAMSGGSYAVAPSCSVGAVSTRGGDRFASYFCAVYPLAGGRWSGRATLVPSGWTIGTGTGDRRVCRYTADIDGSGAIDTNFEHPQAYVGVDGSLPNQNFLVIGSGEACPVGRTPQLPGNNGDGHVDLSTAQHQP